MPKLTVDLTRRESQIMEILYRRRRATVEEIRAELPDAPSPSSVRKLLDIMIERGLLAREYDGPRYVYFPAVKPEEASRSALKQLVRTFFDNSPGSAIAALLDMTSTPLLDGRVPAAEQPAETRPRTGRRAMTAFFLDPAMSAALWIIIKASVLLGAAAIVAAVPVPANVRGDAPPGVDACRRGRCSCFRSCRSRCRSGRVVTRTAATEAADPRRRAASRNRAAMARPSAAIAATPSPRRRARAAASILLRVDAATAAMSRGRP